MATFTLVHGAWHGGWAWDRLRPELEARGHTVATPDLPCEDVDAGVEEYARVVPPADVVVGHSLGGLTIPLVPAHLYVFLCALVPGAGLDGTFVPGFGDARARDELGRSYYPDPADGARELQYPPEAFPLARKLRRQAAKPTGAARDGVVPTGACAYVVCTRDEAIRPDWQRRVAREQLGVEPLELDAGHSPMLTHPGELAALLDLATREAGLAEAPATQDPRIP
jgi:pimeloyl-ACP methyl ester carboxylesterase